MRTNSSLLERLEQLGNAIRLSGNRLVVIALVVTTIWAGGPTAYLGLGEPATPSGVEQASKLSSSGGTGAAQGFVGRSSARLHRGQGNGHELRRVLL